MTDEATDNSTGNAASAAPTNSPEAKAPQPTKVLPTDRIKVEKQFEILRAYANASGPDGTSAVTNADIGKLVNLTASTVSLGNAFWVGCGFLLKDESGYKPSPDVSAFGRAYSWNPETAAHKLAPLMANTWFMRCLLPTLRHREMREDEAVRELAEEAQAAPKYKNQLVTLLDYATTSGLIARENGIIKLVRSPATDSSKVEKPKADVVPPVEQKQEMLHVAPPKVHQSDQGGISMQFTIHVGMAEIASWTPDRIAAFFKGISDIMAAKGNSGDTL